MTTQIDGTRKVHLGVDRVREHMAAATTTTAAALAAVAMRTLVSRKSLVLGFLYGGIVVWIFTRQQKSMPCYKYLVQAPVPMNHSHSRSNNDNNTHNGTTRSNNKRTWNDVVPRDHPHMGARDETGAWNYVPDVQVIRRIALQRIQDDVDSTDPNHYLPLDANSTVCQEAPGEGFEQADGYKALRDYIELNGPDPLPEQDAPVPEHTYSTRAGHLARHRADIYQRQKADETPPRILCGVYTHATSHPKVADVADTWGWRCDGFFAASTQTDRSIGAVDLPHAGDETYGNMWQKTRSMVAFMYDYYLHDYDYFLLCGDDTYVILENLRNYLLLLESQTDGRHAQPLYIGMSFDIWDMRFQLGGPGYLLNRSALRRLVEQGLPFFFADLTVSEEDSSIGAIMTVLHIPFVDTSDAANRQRFFNDPPHVIGSETHPWMYDSLMYKRGNRKGRNVISTQTVSFHRVTSMKRVTAILYNACPIGTVLGDAQKSTLRRSAK
jgi:hypothetical protein